MSAATVSQAKIQPLFFQRPFVRRLLTILGIVLILLLVLYIFVIPWAERWGTTELEWKAELPGDTLVAGPVYQTTKAITIQASPDQVWPWLIQLGVDRGGMYSYDGLENLIGLNVHSTLYPCPTTKTYPGGIKAFV